MSDETRYEPFVVANDYLNRPSDLKKILEENGYLFFKNRAPRDKLLRLRRDAMELCREAGWLAPDRDPVEGIWNGETGPYAEGESEYFAVYRKLLKLPSFLELPEDEALVGLAESILGAPVVVHRRKIGRITFPSNTSQTTAAHQDWHYIRGTPETYTMWMPVGDCPRELGGLAVLRGSHRTGYIEHTGLEGKKFAGDGLTEDLLPRDGTEWHAGDFECGDMLVFHSHTVHKALPNLTPDRLRLSVDNRYQLENTEIEPSSMKSHYDM